jgi:radical SAM superfamily enzyme YgiQ (UPF0313 family)
MLPSPYATGMLEALGNRILYYESSRGCPFSCSYCLSSTTKGVRYLSIDRVRMDLDRFHEAGVKQVKFVDRTFNCNKERAKKIFRHITDSYGAGINFHFETAADLFDDEMLDILSQMPSGLIQLEIGIQSFNEKTLAEVDRKSDMAHLYKNVLRLMAGGNIHIHLDLIAGLPYEDMDSFAASFDRVYSLKPHQLQLGFLKLLKGSRIRKEAAIHGYSFRDYPPYELLYNKYLKYEDINILKGVENLVEKLYNSGRFKRTLEYVTDGSSAFGFYLGLNRYFLDNGIMETPVALRELYAIFYRYICTCLGETAHNGQNRAEAVKDLMKFDFLSTESSGHLPEILRSEPPEGFRNRCHEFLRDKENVRVYLPEYQGMNAAQIMKKVHFEPIGSGIYLFDYSKRDRVTGVYSHTLVKF